MLYLTKRFHFSASHRVYNPGWNDAKNFEVFGKCSNPSGHGHNYVLEVTVSGDPDANTGYIMDLGELKKIVWNDLIDKVDHKHFNNDVEFMKGVNPTVENIVTSFWKIIEPKIKSANRKLFSLKLFETENNIVEYRGENHE